MSELAASNQQFLGKLQRMYSKKGSQTSMSFYAQKPSQQPADNAAVNPIKKEHLLSEQKWQTVQHEFQRLLKPFQQSLTQLLLHINDQNKFYKLLQLIRKHQLLSDISHSINEKTLKENFVLKKQLEQLKINLLHLSNNHPSSRSSNKNPQTNTNPFTSSVQKIDSTRSIPENIYIQAKLMKEDHFLDWCDKILIKNKIVITDLKRDLTPKKHMLKTHNSFHNRSFSAINDTDAQIDHPSFYEQHISLVKKIQQLSPLTDLRVFESIKVSILNDIETLKLQKLSCPKFCCSLENQKHLIDPMRTSNNKLVAKQTSRAKSKNQREVYRNDKTEEYFNRYYKHPSFKVDQVKSVEHTKAEEMNRLQDQYHRMLDNRSKLRYGY